MARTLLERDGAAALVTIARTVPTKRGRIIVTLFPNSNAIGLNNIAYSLMPTRLPASFSLWHRAMRRAKFTNRPVRP